jgi:hypothetical protein
MNNADKARLYAESRRVLAPGGRLALWDTGAGGPLHLRAGVVATHRDSRHVVAQRTDLGGHLCRS